MKDKTGNLHDNLIKVTSVCPFVPSISGREKGIYVDEQQKMVRKCLSIEDHNGQSYGR